MVTNFLWGLKDFTCAPSDVPLMFLPLVRYTGATRSCVQHGSQDGRSPMGWWPTRHLAGSGRGAPAFFFRTRKGGTIVAARH